MCMRPGGKQLMSAELCVGQVVCVRACMRVLCRKYYSPISSIQNNYRAQIIPAMQNHSSNISENCVLTSFLIYM